MTPLDDDFIRSRIMTIRGVQVMFDRDLADIYGVTTKRLNEQVKRNIDRFPPTFRFALSVDEMSELVANCDRFRAMGKKAALSLADSGVLAVPNGCLVRFLSLSVDGEPVAPGEYTYATAPASLKAHLAETTGALFVGSSGTVIFVR